MRDLEKDGKVDDGDAGGDEHGLGCNRVRHRDNEAERDRPAQSAVHHDELVDHAELFLTEAIQNRTLNDHS